MSSPLFGDDPGGGCICPGLSGLRWPGENYPVSGVVKELLLVAIYKDQASSLRMLQFLGPLESDLASSGFTHHAFGQNLTIQSERVNGLAKGEG